MHSSHVEQLWATSWTHRLHRLEVIDDQNQVFISPSELVDNASMVQVASENLQQLAELHWLFLQEESNGLVVELSVADL